MSHRRLEFLRRHWLRSVAVLAVIGVALPSVSAADKSQGRFTLVDGDRVVLLGGTFIEREQAYGYVEAALTARFPDAQVQFRNLGWSGDTVWGEARAGFGTPADGFAQLKQHVLELKPTVILLNYGANESFAGRAGLADFNAGLSTLLAALDETKARVVFLSPTPHEDLGRPLPNPARHNEQLRLYTAELAKVAAQRNEPLVNLFELLGKQLAPPAAIPLTDNGLHLTAYGYWRAAPVIEQGLGLTPRAWTIEIDATRHNIAARGTSISEASFVGGAIRFLARDAQLPAAPPPAASPQAAGPAPRVLRVDGLEAGQYTLSVDGEVVAGPAPAAAWSNGVAIDRGPDFAQSEQLRQAILAKNALYFHRWRPQNVTYLLGFRKHEQGQNAVEIPQFDPLIEQQEAAIHDLAAPQARRYELTRVSAP
ncbi:MAG: SGNH/GDSL hydrolase family protein [Pirellulales bacterium]